MRTAELTRPVKRDAQFSYVLDCAVELGEVTPMEASVFMVDNSAALSLSDSMDGDGSWNPHFLRNTARAYLDGLTQKERWLYALKGLEGMDYALKALIERMEFVAQKKVQTDLGMDDAQPIRWLAEASALDAFDGKLFGSVHDITPDRVLQFVQPKFGPVRALIEQDLDLAIEAMDWLQQPGARAEARELAASLFRVSAKPTGITLPSGKVVKKVNAEHKKKLRHQARGAIKKALNLLSSFGMEKNVQMLVSGGTVTLSHPDSPFKFEVSPLKEGWLEERTLRPGCTTPFKLSVMTKDGVFLTRLCVLFRDTPVLDQLLALAMYVQTGNEMEVLTTANWFGFEDAELVRSVLTATSPDLLRKLPAPGSRTGLGLLAEDEPGGIHALHAHWEPYRGPVRTWLGEWFGPAARTLRLLQDNAPQLALA